MHDFEDFSFHLGIHTVLNLMEWSALPIDPSLPCRKMKDRRLFTHSRLFKWWTLSMKISMLFHLLCQGPVHGTKNMVTVTIALIYQLISASCPDIAILVDWA